MLYEVKGKRCPLRYTLLDVLQAQKLSTFDACREYDPSQELIFPPELQVNCSALTKVISSVHRLESGTKSLSAWIAMG